MTYRLPDSWVHVLDDWLGDKHPRNAYHRYYHQCSLYVTLRELKFKGVIMFPFLS